MPIGGRAVEKVAEVHEVVDADDHLIMAGIFVVVLPRSSERHGRGPHEHLKQPGMIQALQRIVF